MRTRLRSVIGRPLLLVMSLICGLSGPAQAQAPSDLASLTVALWPEYDQPSVLVIYRGAVPEEAALPAPVSFVLPTSVGSLHAIAYVDQEQRGLVNIPDYEFVAGADGKVLSFATPARQFQFEYYSSDVLSLRDKVRNISFSFTSSAAIGTLVFELQQPSAAEEFKTDPPVTLTEVRQDGLTYASYDLGSVPSGESRSLVASYTRSTNELSVNALAAVSVPTASEQKPIEVGGAGVADNLGPILIAAGVLLLIAALGYWYWSQRTLVVPEASPRRPPAQQRRPARRKDVVVSGPRRPAHSQTLATYCHRCGSKFREDASFCHACGAERRAE